MDSLIYVAGVVLAIAIGMYFQWKVYSTKGAYDKAVNEHKPINPNLPENSYGVGDVEFYKYENAKRVNFWVRCGVIGTVILLLVLSGQESDPVNAALTAAGVLLLRTA